MTLSIAIVGAAGRMGREVIRVLADTPSCTLGAALEAEGHPSLGMDAGEVAGARRLSIPLTSDLNAGLEQCRVAIHFATADVTIPFVEAALRCRVPAVIAATGLTEEAFAAVRAAAKALPLVVAPNMSVGMNLLFALLPRVAEALGTDYDVGVTEIHHRAKRDAPSGTALRIAEILRKARGSDIPVVSLRGGGVVGDHTVFFLGRGERLELSHRAESRETFALGALRAAMWVADKAPGLYDMQDVLGLR